MYYKDTNNKIKNTFGQVLDSQEIIKNGLFKKTDLINLNPSQELAKEQKLIDCNTISISDELTKFEINKEQKTTDSINLNINTKPIPNNIDQLTNVDESKQPKKTDTNRNKYKKYLTPVLTSFLCVILVISSTSFAINKLTSQNIRNNNSLLPQNTDQSILGEKMVETLITSEQIKNSKDSYSKMDTFTGYMLFEKDENLGNYFDKNSFKKELDSSLELMKKELPDFKLPQPTFWSVQTSSEWKNFKDNYKSNLVILYSCSYNIDCNPEDKLPAFKKDILNTYAIIKPTLDSYIKTIDLTCIRGVKENKKIKEMPICNGSLKKQLQKLQGFINTDKQYYNQDSYTSYNNKQKTILAIDSIITMVKLNNEMYSVLK